jgi:V/A-type H+-transporting ATPase subunit D
MSQQIVPTKGNLQNSKKTLSLARMGYELLDRKRQILVREMMPLIDRAAAIQERIDSCYAEAYHALQQANVAHGFCGAIANAVPVETGLSMTSRSVMGVEIPLLQLEAAPPAMEYGFLFTSSLVDEAYICFDRVKHLTVELAEIENSIYRLAVNIKKTQKRANALRNMVIPRMEGAVRFIGGALEEKEREDFSRLKVLKKKQKE